MCTGTLFELRGQMPNPLNPVVNTSEGGKI